MSLFLLFMTAMGGGAELPRQTTYQVRVNDAELLKGKWRVDTVVFGGAAIPLNQGPSLTLTFNGSKVVLREKDMTEEAAVVLDPAKSPKHIDIRPKNIQLVGIYEIRGDTLRICLGSPRSPRPTSFESTNASQNILVVLQRERK